MMNKEEKYSEEMIALAHKMEKAADGYNPREIFFAAALLMSWALSVQNKEVRTHAISMAMDLIDRGHNLFGKPKPLNS